MEFMKILNLVFSFQMSNIKLARQLVEGKGKCLLEELINHFKNLKLDKFDSKLFENVLKLSEEYLYFDLKDTHCNDLVLEYLNTYVEKLRKNYKKMQSRIEEMSEIDFTFPEGFNNIVESEMTFGNFDIMRLYFKLGGRDKGLKIISKTHIKDPNFDMDLVEMELRSVEVTDVNWERTYISGLVAKDLFGGGELKDLLIERHNLFHEGEKLARKLKRLKEILDKFVVVHSKLKLKEKQKEPINLEVGQKYTIDRQVYLLIRGRFTEYPNVEVKLVTKNRVELETTYKKGYFYAEETHYNFGLNDDRKTMDRSEAEKILKEYYVLVE